MENLFLAWREFSRGKMKKKDVLEFEKAALIRDEIGELRKLRVK